MYFASIYLLRDSDDHLNVNLLEQDWMVNYWMERNGTVLLLLQNTTQNENLQFNTF